MKGHIYFLYRKKKLPLTNIAFNVNRRGKRIASYRGKFQRNRIKDFPELAKIKYGN